MNWSLSIRSSIHPCRFIAARVATKSIAAVTIMVLYAVFTGEASAGLAGDFVYNNLLETNSTSEFDRISTVGRGLGDSFAASGNANIKTAVFGLVNLNGNTGDLVTALYNVTGSTDANYAIGSLVGTSATIHIADLSNLGIYTSVDLTDLGWNLVSGQNYAVGLYAAANYYNSTPSADGIKWSVGAGTAANLVRFNNWAVGGDPWQNWGQNPRNGFSVGLATSAVSANVPEIDPATGSSALSLVAGVLAMIEQRRRRRGAIAPLSA